MSVRHGGTLNSRRAASPFVRLMAGEEKLAAGRNVFPVSGTFLTGLLAYRPICTKRLYTVCRETVVPMVADS
ncbi:hypothetical protein TNCV_2597681 [Trichonephila clavipes]|nr:hypothetical protein TNCV_2597681 [Trichonephila clavipes]